MNRFTHSILVVPNLPEIYWTFFCWKTGQGCFLQWISLLLAKLVFWGSLGNLFILDHWWCYPCYVNGLILTFCDSCTSQIMGYTGIIYSSPTLASAISNLVPAFTFILAVIFRFVTHLKRLFATLIVSVKSLNILYY